MKLARVWATWGAVVGVGIAVILLSLDQHGPFIMLGRHAILASELVEHATFRLCPLFVLGFVVNTSMAWLVVITVAGNAILYGIVFGIIAYLKMLFEKLFARGSKKGS